jgi:hypothetical protein
MFDKKQILTQEQILYFIKNHEDKLRDDGYATFFLFESHGEFFVAYVYFYSFGSLSVSVGRFESAFVWGAEYRRRLVVPQFRKIKELHKQELADQKKELLEDLKREMAGRWADKCQIMLADVYEIIDEFIKI